jgi:putative cell wall-binding protein/Tol biopolymer transport system component
MATTTHSRLLSVVLALAMLASVVAGITPSAAQDGSPVFTESAEIARWQGPDRFSTAAAVSAATFPAGADIAFVATGSNFPDALAGGPVGALRGGPILLTSQGSLPQVTIAELQRLAPSTIVVLGGPAVVSAGVEAQLRTYASTVERWAGPDRFATAAAVSRAAFTPGIDTVLIATGANFPDALAGGPAGGILGAPILLTTAGALPQATVTELQRLAPINRIVILGGPGVVSEAVAQQLAGYATGTGYTSSAVARWSGPDRFATAAAISSAMFRTGAGIVFVATGANFPDALAGGPAGGSMIGPILLTTAGALPAVTAAEVQRLQPTKIVVLGGAAAVSDAVMAELAALSGPGEPTQPTEPPTQPTEPPTQPTEPPDDPALIIRVSVTHDGMEADGHADHSAISADGRYVAFTASAPQMVPGLVGNPMNVYVRDMLTGQLELVSKASDGTPSFGSQNPAISADGRYVAFQSEAHTLVPNDTNGMHDVFVHDRQTGTTERVSVASDCTQCNWSSRRPAISSDGRYVAFQSESTTLVPGGQNGKDHIYVHDRQTGTTERVSVASNGTLANDDSYDASVSADGRHVAFTSAAYNLSPHTELASIGDVFVHDRQTGTTTYVTEPVNTRSARSDYRAAISGDGRHVAFHTSSGQYDDDAVGEQIRVYVRDLQTGVYERIDVATDGTPSNGDADTFDTPRISHDGRYVVFTSAGTNLVPGDTNGNVDIFVRDRHLGTTTRVNTAEDGTQTDPAPQGHPETRLHDSMWPAISADGRYVTFTTLAPNLVPDDTNGRRDVFRIDRGPTAGR